MHRQGRTIDIPAATKRKAEIYLEVADDKRLVAPVIEILNLALARGACWWLVNPVSCTGDEVEGS